MRRWVAVIAGFVAFWAVLASTGMAEQSALVMPGLGIGRGVERMTVSTLSCIPRRCDHG